MEELRGPSEELRELRGAVDELVARQARLKDGGGRVEELATHEKGLLATLREEVRRLQGVRAPTVGEGAALAREVEALKYQVNPPCTPPLSHSPPLSQTRHPSHYHYPEAHATPPLSHPPPLPLPPCSQAEQSEVSQRKLVSDLTSSFQAERERLQQASSHPHPRRASGR